MIGDESPAPHCPAGHLSPQAGRETLAAMKASFSPFYGEKMAAAR